MNGLSTKQRAKINAALCLVHDNGFDANAITAQARSLMSNGADARSAYERALNNFADKNPTALPALSKVVGLVEASDDATVARYDAALASYIATGDDSEISALAPIIADDMAALAAKNGEPAPDFSPEFQQAAAKPPSEQKANSFAFNVSEVQQAMAGRQVVGTAEDGSPIVRTQSQLSLTGASGMVAPKAQQAWAEVPYVGAVSATPALHGLNPSAAREAAKARVLDGSRAIISGASAEDAA